MSGGGDGRGPVFLTSGQRTSTTVLLTEVAVGRGMDVRSLDDPADGARWADTVDSAAGAVHWYGGPLAAERIATSNSSPSTDIRHGSLATITTRHPLMYMHDHTYLRLTPR